MTIVERNPHISVIMPVWKPNPVFFRQAVLSILQQTYRDFELLIVERVSADKADAARFLESMPDSRIRYFTLSPQASLVEQRNYGLSQARGEMVAMMDADDISDTNRFEKQLDYLNRHPEIDLLASDVRIINRDGKLLGHRIFPRQHQSIEKALSRLNVICQSGVMCARELLVQAGGYRQTDYHGVEDYELWCRLIKNGARFATYPATLVSYRIHAEQVKYLQFYDTVRGTLDIKALYWQDADDVADRVRKHIESALLYVPRQIAFWVCVQVRYRRKPRLPVTAT